MNRSKLEGISLSCEIEISPFLLGKLRAKMHDTCESSHESDSQNSNRKDTHTRHQTRGKAIRRDRSEVEPILL